MHGWIPVIATLLLVCCAATTVKGQIFESICRDANCTDVAVGPLALLPTCYRSSIGSARLRLNETDPNKLELCFYNTDDCIDDDVDISANRTIKRTCHTFTNGETCDCPFLLGMNRTTLYIKFTWDPSTAQLMADMFDMMPNRQRASRQFLNNFFGLSEFGNWCGPEHGGTYDCCGDDDKCSQCNYPNLTTACLNQCRPRDQLDRACAIHDFCTNNNDYERVLPGDDFECESVFGTLEAEYCACDCQLVRSATRIRNTNSFYRNALIFTFTHVTNCWYNTNNGPVCNEGGDQILVTEFC